MLEATGKLPDNMEAVIIAHLRDNCAFEFQGSHTLLAEELPFYSRTYHFRLLLEAGTTLRIGKRTQVLPQGAEFQFLFYDVLGDQRLVPLSNDRSNILLANRWLGLKFRTDEDRIKYARFYYGMSRVERSGESLNIPDATASVCFGPTATNEQKWAVFGAMWRFLDSNTRTSLTVRFEERGAFQWTRHCAYVPAQLGDALFDVELKIWRRDGHITYNRSQPIYEGSALQGVPLPKLGRIALPGYIRWHERLRFYYQKAWATVGQAAYAASTLVFIVASITSVLFLLEFVDFPIVRLGMQQLLSDWKIPLSIVAGYCVAYFIFTTALILDVDTVRSALHRWVPGIKGTRVDSILYEVSRRQHRSERGYKPSLWKRVLWSGFLLVFWSLYLIAIFTALDTSLQKHIDPDKERMLDVTVVLAEQALLYVPMVVYYAGWSFLEPQKIAILDTMVLSSFRLIIGLLVIRRIHRFWAATASPKLEIKASAFRHRSER